MNELAPLPMSCLQLPENTSIHSGSLHFKNIRLTHLGHKGMFNNRYPCRFYFWSTLLACMDNSACRVHLCMQQNPCILIYSTTFSNDQVLPILEQNI